MQFAALFSIKREVYCPFLHICCTVTNSMSPSSSSMEVLSGTGWLADMPRPRLRARPRQRPRGLAFTSSGAVAGSATVGAPQSSSRTRRGPCQENFRDCYGVNNTNRSPVASPGRRMDAHPPHPFSPASSSSDVPSACAPPADVSTTWGA